MGFFYQRINTHPYTELRMMIPGPARDGWIASKYNLWEGIPADYNSATGYEYSAEDLRMRYWILNSPESYRGFKIELLRREAAGMGDPITGNEYWKKYGHTLGNMILMDFYINTADGLTSCDGINGMKRARVAYPSIRPKGSTKSSAPDTFKEYLQSQKGKDIGKYPGRGNWMKAQAKKYNQLKNGMRLQ